MISTKIIKHKNKTYPNNRSYTLSFKLDSLYELDTILEALQKNMFKPTKGGVNVRMRQTIAESLCAAYKKAGINSG